MSDRRRLTAACAVLAALIFLVPPASAQTSRKRVSRKEVTGIFYRSFPDKFEGSMAEIKILFLGKGKLKIAFHLIYTYVARNGDLAANVGQIAGEADIKGDTAVFSTDEYGPCTITIKFVRPGSLNITQEGDGSGCGFGRNVTADGPYHRTSSAKPRFDRFDP